MHISLTDLMKTLNIKKTAHELQIVSSISEKSTDFVEIQKKFESQNIISTIVSNQLERSITQATSRI